VDRFNVVLYQLDGDREGFRASLERLGIHNLYLFPLEPPHVFVVMREDVYPLYEEFVREHYQRETTLEPLFPIEKRVFVYGSSPWASRRCTERCARSERAARAASLESSAPGSGTTKARVISTRRCETSASSAIWAASEEARASQLDGCAASFLKKSPPFASRKMPH
jgi:hypothetical protein